MLGFFSAKAKVGKMGSIILRWQRWQGWQRFISTTYGKYLRWQTLTKVDTFGIFRKCRSQALTLLLYIFFNQKRYIIVYQRLSCWWFRVSTCQPMTPPKCVYPFYSNFFIGSSWLGKSNRCRPLSPFFIWIIRIQWVFLRSYNHRVFRLFLIFSWINAVGGTFS